MEDDAQGCAIGCVVFLLVLMILSVLSLVLNVANHVGIPHCELYAGTVWEWLGRVQC